MTGLWYPGHWWLLRWIKNDFPPTIRNPIGLTVFRRCRVWRLHLLTPGPVYDTTYLDQVSYKTFTGIVTLQSGCSSARLRYRPHQPGNRHFIPSCQFLTAFPNPAQIRYRRSSAKSCDRRFQLPGQLVYRNQDLSGMEEKVNVSDLQQAFTFRIKQVLLRGPWKYLIR